MLEAEQVIVGHGITHWFASLPSMPPRRQVFRRGRGVLQRAHELGARQLWELRSRCDEQVTFRGACARNPQNWFASAKRGKFAISSTCIFKKVRIFSYKNKVR